MMFCLIALNYATVHMGTAETLVYSSIKRWTENDLNPPKRDEYTFILSIRFVEADTILIFPLPN